MSGERTLFGAGAGRTANDIVWRQSVRAELCTNDNRSTATVLLDLRKCYEYVQHMTLVAGGMAHGYPLWMLRLTVASYSWTRHVKQGPLIHAGVFAHRGIIAGCATATSELKAYMFTTLSNVRCRHPEANVEAYIDDLPVEAHCDKDDGLVEILTDVVLDIRVSFKNQLGLEIADGKTMVVANSADTARRIAKLVGTPEAAVAQAKHLGVDYTAGKKPTNKGSVREARLVKGKQKTATAKAKLDKKNQLTVFHTGVLPGVAYGAEVTGPHLPTIRWARRSVAALLPGGGRGRLDALWPMFPKGDPTQGEEC